MMLFGAANDDHHKSPKCFLVLSEILNSKALGSMLYFATTYSLALKLLLSASFIHFLAVIIAFGSPSFEALSTGYTPLPLTLGCSSLNVTSCLSNKHALHKYLFPLALAIAPLLFVAPDKPGRPNRVLLGYEATLNTFCTMLYWLVDAVSLDCLSLLGFGDCDGEGAAKSCRLAGAERPLS